MKSRFLTPFAALAVAAALLPAAPASATGAHSSTAADPAQTVTIGRQPDGTILLPDGQRIDPAGKQVELPGSPTGLAIAPDGRTAVVHLGGDNGSQLYVISLPDGKVLQAGDPAGGAASYAGIAYSPDGSHVFASDAGGNVVIFNVNPDGTLGAARKVAMPADQTKFYVGNGGAYPGGLAPSADGKTLYVALSVTNQLAVVDVASATVTTTIPVGNAPHSVIVDGGLAYVTNEGGRPAQPGDFVSYSAGTPMVADPFTAATTTGTVSVVDLSARKQIDTIPVGLHPTAMALDSGRLLVANTNSDTVSQIDTTSLAVTRTLHVSMYDGAPYGSEPNGVAVTPDNHLEITLGRDNALEDLSLRHPGRRGLIPTGWFPADVAYDAATGQIVAVTNQGIGSLQDAEAGRHGRGVGGEIGTMSLLHEPSRHELRRDTHRVFKLNGWDTADPSNVPEDGNPVPPVLGDPTPIKHVVYIIRENRTYDQILGDIGKGNSDPALVNYGAQVTPNAHALANEFPLLDNYYVSGRRSNDGHQWAVGAQDPDYFQRATGNDKRSDWNAPSSGFDSMLYTPSGFLWENALNHGESVVDFGEYTKEDFSPPAYSDIPSLEAHVMPEFPGFQLNEPDQVRARDYITQLTAYELAGKMPDLTLMTLPNDHTGGNDPLFNSPEAEVADNDAALGRIVDAISHSSFWSSTAIFVCEDDAQGGADHVDGHRSVAFVISPYVKRHIVDSTFSTQVAMVRTIEQLLGLPPMNHVDAGVEPMRSMWTSTPDLTPFNALPPNVGTNVPNPQLSTLHGLQREWAAAMLAQNFKTADSGDPELVRRDLWYDSRGWSSPFPGDRRVLHPWEVHTSRASAAFGTTVGEAAG